MKLGLRIDVDTSRGTLKGVPALCKLLSDNGITATFFFSVGPDNMGKHVRRLLKPAFLKKMVRSNAPGLYGWDIFLKGTFWPGPVIGKTAQDIFQCAAADGHEIGIHAWDHYRWQSEIPGLSKDKIFQELFLGYRMLEDILGKPPTCSASPGWVCNNSVLEQKELFSFTYNSDCRGRDIFYPLVNSVALGCPQIPVTLPTYDEIIGNGRITDYNYNTYLVSLIKPEQLNVLTIHAEVEGILCRDMFKKFIKMCIQRKISILPLGKLLPHAPKIKTCLVGLDEIPGREGRIAVQSPCPKD